MATICKTCGATVERVGNYYICEFCGNKWEIDSSNDVHAVERANAWSALRDGDFEKATELFENIIIKENENHEAYWGRALAMSGIVYVTDLSENKKVPTCNNITEESFINNKDVQKAIATAPEDIAEGYAEQAEYIEKVRLEWLEKASKEPEYDVFISFKDSDRENGIERTQDSIDAQDLYNALVAEGYKVFFSRISLRDKISEQYEPYIYNAIKTAKVMIVFGEKAEYFNSVWIKNEWSRFKTRIEKGEKHKNSLVVVYKNLNPSDLPVVLKSRQCLNASDMTFLSDLTRHIKRVVEETKKSVRLEKIEIAGGQIAKKATSLSVNPVQTREIGEGVIAETSISEKQSLSLVQAYLDSEDWQEAERLLEEILFNNPSCAEAIWFSLLAKYRAANKEVLIKTLDKFRMNDYEILEKVLNCASKEFAEKILLLLYNADKESKTETYKCVLETILPFSFKQRQKEITGAFERVIQSGKFEPFSLLLNTLESSEVDRYIMYNQKYARITLKNDEKAKCLSNILKVDEGNIEALREVLYCSLTMNNGIDELIQCLETLLQYAQNPNEEVINCLDWLGKNLNNLDHVNFAKQLIRYYTEDTSDLKKGLIELSYRIISVRLYSMAEYFLNLIISVDANNSEVYWAICLMKIEAASEEEILYRSKLLKDVPEFNRYLILVDEERRKTCIAISKKQVEVGETKCLETLGKEYDELINYRNNLEKKKMEFDVKLSGGSVGKWILVIGLIFTTILIIFLIAGATIDVTLVLVAITGIGGIYTGIADMVEEKSNASYNTQERDKVIEELNKMGKIPSRANYIALNRNRFYEQYDKDNDARVS